MVSHSNGMAALSVTSTSESLHDKYDAFEGSRLRRTPAMRVTRITLIGHTELLMTAKTSVTSLIVWCLFSSPTILWAQATPPQDPPSQAASSSAGQQVEVENDIYKGLREVADSFKAEYVRAIEAKLALVRRWLATRKCQSARINPAIAEVVAALEQWRSREVDYWQKWNEEEAIKAQRTAKQIEDYKVRQAEAKSLKEDYDDDLATMQKKFDDLEKGPKNPETRKKADSLNTSMQEKRTAIDAVAKTKQPAPVVSTNFYASNLDLGAIPPYFIHQLGRSRWTIDVQAFQTITTDCHLKQPSAHQDCALIVLT